MGLIKNLIGAGPLDAVEAVGKVLDNLTTSDEERAAAALVLERLRQKPHVLQAEIGKIEAGHRSLFVAGWRPFIGWVCGLGLFWVFLGQPMAQWVIVLMDVPIEAPKLADERLFELVMAMLGLGGLRTYEKLKGRAW